MAYAGGAAAAAHAASIAQAIKASGAIVNVSPRDFGMIIARAEKPLVIFAQGGILKKNYQYLTSYKGLAFYTRSSVPLDTGDAELIVAEKIWIPG
jgi:hypothetical protein